MGVLKLTPLGTEDARAWPHPFAIASQQKELQQDRNFHKDYYLRPLLTGACSLLTFLKKSSCKLLLQIKNEVLKNLNLTRYETI